MVLQFSEAEKLSHSIKPNTDVPQKQYRRKLPVFRILFSVIVIFSSENHLRFAISGFSYSGIKLSAMSSISTG